MGLIRLRHQFARSTWESILHRRVHRISITEDELPEASIVLVRVSSKADDAESANRP
jgi:hypothetical protein